MSTNFLSIDLGGTDPRAVDFTAVEVLISPDLILGSYAKAFVAESIRVAPQIADHIKLTEDEVGQYCHYLITKRVQMVNQECADARRLRVLYIPSYVQFVISTVGIVVDRTFGLELKPKMLEESSMKFEQALEISNKIGAFVDKLQIVQDAMPRDWHGDEDVMASALIDGAIRSYKVLTHPAATYATAFLGSQLKKDEALKALYRISYDDLGFIAAALTTQKGIF